MLHLLDLLIESGNLLDILRPHLKLAISRLLDDQVLFLDVLQLFTLSLLL